ncbi:MAG: NAD-dependent deacetylase [Candidatus Hermodarchaeota archaeon]
MTLTEDKIEQIATLIANSLHLVIFTGAGISTESGLPDFRGPEGIWTLRDKGLKPKLPKVPWHEVQPNPAHISILELQNMGLMKFLISQNVDNLHLKSGIKPDFIAELHGNSTLLKCFSCDQRIAKKDADWDDQLYGRGYRTSKEIQGQPRCSACGGRLISSVINFGDPMPQKEMDDATWHSQHSDVFISIGSTLLVLPAASFPRIALENGAQLIIINKGETALDHVAHIRIEGKAGEILPKIVKQVKEKLDQMKNQ